MLVPTTHRHASYQHADADLPSADTALARQRLKRQVLDALGAAASQPPHKTFGYRRRGTDTLTWGSPKDWLNVRMAACLLDGPPEARSIGENCLLQYEELRQLLSSMEASGLCRLQDHYSFRHAQAVERFLDRHPQLIDLIIEAHPHVAQHFGPEVHVVLEVVRDPEGETSEQLFAYISTTLPACEALACLDRVDEEWFLNQLDVAGGLFNFNLEAA